MKTYPESCVIYFLRTRAVHMAVVANPRKRILKIIKTTNDTIKVNLNKIGYGWK